MDPQTQQTASSDSQTSDRASALPPDDQRPTEAFKDAGRKFAELGEYVSYYIAAKFDGIKGSVRNIGIYAALGVVGLIATAGFVVTAVVLLCRGIAGAFAALFGGRVWQ